MDLEPIHTALNDDDSEGNSEGRTLIDLSSTRLIVLPKFEMKNLKQLYLENNFLTELPENMFTEAPNLRWLDLRNNKLINIPTSVMNHQYLETILLQNNKLTHLPNYLSTAKSVKHLKLSGNPILFPPMDVIKSGTDSIMNFLNFYYESENAANDVQKTCDKSIAVSIKSVPSSENCLQNGETEKINSSIKQIECNNEEFDFENRIMNQDILKVNNDSKFLVKIKSDIKKAQDNQIKSYQIKTPILSVKKINKEFKANKKKSFDKLHHFPNHSICSLEYEKSNKSNEVHKTDSTLFKYFNSNKYVRKTKVLSKQEQSLKIVQTALEEKVLERKKDLLTRREKVLQDRKSLDALKHWRTNYKDGKDNNTTHMYYTLNLSNFPYDTDIERVKILTRADIEQDLPDKYKKSIRNKSKVMNQRHKEKTHIQMRILEVADRMDSINARHNEDTPRTVQHMAASEIRKCTGDEAINGASSSGASSIEITIEKGQQYYLMSVLQRLQSEGKLTDHSFLPRVKRFFSGIWGSKSKLTDLKQRILRLKLDNEIGG